MLASSHHAFVRLMLEDDALLEQLVEVLSKRVEYGIFPDQFTYNLLLDRLLDTGRLEEAAKVAVLRMLQEDFDSLIGNYLSLKAVGDYLRTGEIKPELFSEPKPEADEENAEGDEDEEEVEYVRIPYLRNPFFDDHFDIKDTTSLIGKTFYLVGNAIGDSNRELSDNCVLYGLALYKRWTQALEFLNSNLNTLRLSDDLCELIEKFVTSQKIEDSNAGELLDKLKNCKGRTGKTLEQSIEAAVSTIGQLEIDEIVKLKDVLRAFAKGRETKMKQDLDDLLKLEMIEAIREKKQEFKNRETKLYFFENIENFKLLEHEAKVKIKEAEDSMKIEVDYVPPTLRDFERKRQNFEEKKNK